MSEQSFLTAELDAINLYEQMAAMTGNDNIKKILLDIAREEKTHVGEFQALLLREDREQGPTLYHALGSPLPIREILDYPSLWRQPLISPNHYLITEDT